MDVLLWTAFIGLLCGWVTYLNAPGRSGQQERVPVRVSTEESEPARFENRGGL